MGRLAWPAKLRQMIQSNKVSKKFYSGREKHGHFQQRRSCRPRREFTILRCVTRLSTWSRNLENSFKPISVNCFTGYVERSEIWLLLYKFISFHHRTTKVDLYIRDLKSFVKCHILPWMPHSKALSLHLKYDQDLFFFGSEIVKGRERE